MFGDWNDDDWCEFDNYMIGCLKSYLGTGLVKTNFVNLKIRQLSAETCHEFIEWCGLVEGQDRSSVLEPNTRLYKNDLYYNFIEEHPDYSPRGRMSISRTRFYKWLLSYGAFKDGLVAEEGRDQQGRWIIFKKNIN
jgi:hypothetical protein